MQPGVLRGHPRQPNYFESFDHEQAFRSAPSPAIGSVPVSVSSPSACARRVPLARSRCFPTRPVPFRQAKVTGAQRKN
jgi:hypothetical protein